MFKNLPPYLFPSVSWFLYGIQQGVIRVAVGGCFEKQTFRSRYTIAGPNNLQTLSVPIIHGGSKQLCDTRISQQNPWINDHIRAITTAYGRAPFFEFYDYRLWPILQQETTSLKQLIEHSITFLHRQLQCPVALEFVNEVPFAEPSLPAQPYPQVFQDRHGFQGAVSALDLLFNVGPEAEDYWVDPAGV
jgi:hypothetical protein